MSQEQAEQRTYEVEIVKEEWREQNHSACLHYRIVEKDDAGKIVNISPVRTWEPHLQGHPDAQDIERHFDRNMKNAVDCLARSSSNAPALHDLLCRKTAKRPSVTFCDKRAESLARLAAD